MRTRYTTCRAETCGSQPSWCTTCRSQPLLLLWNPLRTKQRWTLWHLIDLAAHLARRALHSWTLLHSLHRRVPTGGETCHIRCCLCCRWQSFCNHLPHLFQLTRTRTTFTLTRTCAHIAGSTPELWCPVSASEKCAFGKLVHRLLQSCYLRVIPAPHSNLCRRCSNVHCRDSFAQVERAVRDVSLKLQQYDRNPADLFTKCLNSKLFCRQRFAVAIGLAAVSELRTVEVHQSPRFDKWWGRYPTLLMSLSVSSVTKNSATAVRMWQRVEQKFHSSLVKNMMPWQSSEAVYWSGLLRVVFETHDVFQRQLYVFRIGVVNDLNAYSRMHSTGGSLCRWSISKGGMEISGLWWDEPLATLYLHAVCMTALNWEDERSERDGIRHFWLHEEEWEFVWIWAEQFYKLS